MQFHKYRPKEHLCIYCFKAKTEKIKERKKCWPPKNAFFSLNNQVFFIFFISSSFKNNRRTNVLLVCIFFKTHQKRYYTVTGTIKLGVLQYSFHQTTKLGLFTVQSTVIMILGLLAEELSEMYQLACKFIGTWLAEIFFLLLLCEIEIFHCMLYKIEIFPCMLCKFCIFHIAC